MQLLNEDRDALCQLLMFGGPEEAATEIKGLMSMGLDSRELYLDLLNPISKHLDTLWLEDRASFVSVRVATLRIEALIADVAHPVSPIIARQKKQAVFASLPDEEHTIGVKMAADLKHAKGWDIQLITKTSFMDMYLEILKSPAEILGISIGSSAAVHRLYTLVWTLRDRRPDMSILVSGSLISAEARSIKHLGRSKVDLRPTFVMLQAQPALRSFAAGEVVGPCRVVTGSRLSLLKIGSKRTLGAELQRDRHVFRRHLMV